MTFYMNHAASLTPRRNIGGAVASFLSKNAVFCAAVAAAAITSVIVPPDAEYLGYFDFKTLACLFSVLAVVCALRDIDFFYVLARRITDKFSTTRSCYLALCWITFLGSMFIANDMALITFLPLGWVILESAGRKQDTAFLFIMQNISANLGGMLTPFGNPQNLYLYSYYNIPNLEFVEIMLPPFIAAVAMITVCCLCVKNAPITAQGETGSVKSRPKEIILLFLFGLAVAIVFREIPYLAGMLIIIAALFFIDRSALLQVDYFLLGTFAAFFVFAGNMSRIPAVRGLFSALLGKSTLLFSELSCQVISNVPSAILLSQFTDNYRELLLGVNIGGTGTLIASLASLITFREFQRRSPGKTGHYLARFALLNLLFLGALTVVALIEVNS